MAEYYVVYKVVLLFYEEYRRSRYVLDDIELDLSASLIDLYSGVDVRLQDVDRQFAKYGLLSFNENMRFDCDHLARGVVDKRLNKFLVSRFRKFWLSPSISCIRMARWARSHSE